ncbi:MAG: hypothetical protein NBKEAIPA_00888 [Nitrospirae bacterium]|nr:MAG: hypothetical protein UZ03_NOB001001069 [Nitrospira sp. OLB3]MBV6469006.1 hypothetical protein [Nitrospirota bacterium]
MQFLLEVEWPLCSNMSGRCTSISGPIGETRLPSICGARKPVVRSVHACIRGMKLWGPVRRRIRRRRISKKSGRGRGWPLTCIQGLPGNAASSRKSRHPPSPLRRRNQPPHRWPRPLRLRLLLLLPHHRLRLQRRRTPSHRPSHPPNLIGSLTLLLTGPFPPAWKCSSLSW